MCLLAKKIITIILAVLNGLMFTIIIISLLSGWRIGNTSEPSPTYSVYTDPPQTETTAEPTQAQTEHKETTQKATKAPTTAKPAEKKPTEAPEPVTPKKKSPFPDSSTMSTNEKAGLRDSEGFSWKEGWTYLSSNKQVINDFSALKGGWKAVMISDPQNKREGMFTDYLNVEISGTDIDTVVTLKWRERLMSNSGGSVIDVSGYDSNLAGSFLGGEIEAVGSGKITLTDFYYDNGKEFAEGKYIWTDGVEGYIGLIRP